MTQPAHLDERNQQSRQPYPTQVCSQSYLTAARPRSPLAAEPSWKANPAASLQARSKPTPVASSMCSRSRQLRYLRGRPGRQGGRGGGCRTKAGGGTRAARAGAGAWRRRQPAVGRNPGRRGSPAAPTCARSCNQGSAACGRGPAGPALRSSLLGGGQGPGTLPQPSAAFLPAPHLKRWASGRALEQRRVTALLAVLSSSGRLNELATASMRARLAPSRRPRMAERQRSGRDSSEGASPEPQGQLITIDRGCERAGAKTAGRAGTAPLWPGVTAGPCAGFVV